ncbi:hypothetical protein ACF0H5_004612 [Mactra antiquata]
MVYCDKRRESCKGRNRFVDIVEDDDEDAELLDLQRELAVARQEEAAERRLKQKELLRKQIKQSWENVKKMKGKKAINPSDSEVDHSTNPSTKYRKEYGHSADRETITLDSLRNDKRLKHMVQKQIKKLGLLESESSSNSDTSDSDSIDSSSESIDSDTAKAGASKKKN